MEKSEGTSMTDKYENITFFRQRIVRKQGTKMVIQEEEYELLLRCWIDGHYTFPQKEFEQAILNPIEHKDYLKKIGRLLEDILQTTSGIYSINIEPQQLYYEETFVLFEHFQKFNKRLKIELTEHLPYQRKGDYTTPFPLERIVKLHEWGYEIVLDDFLSGINGIDKLISLSPLISRVKISKLAFKEEVSDSRFCFFVFEIAKLIQEINPGLSLVIEAEESKEMIEKYSDTWYYQTYFFDTPSPII